MLKMRLAKCIEVVYPRNVVFIVAVIFFIDSLTFTLGNENRDSRKLFGGYRITPAYCKATRAAKYNRGNTICMFNHECSQRGGEVVGACMDGFLFGACCQLKSDSQSHIPKGPGVVMTSYLDYSEADPDSEDYESEQLSALHDSYKPIVTPGYRPTDKSNPVKSSTEKSVTDMNDSFSISEGLSQITNTLLHEPNKNSVIVTNKKPDEVYTHSAINHGLADTILVHRNGTEADDIVRPSDFNIHISSMQTKPTMMPSSMTSTTTTPKTVSTHLPIYTKPIFKPKPNKNKTEIYRPFKTSTEKYVPLSTASKENNVTELSSINSIIQMLNDSTPSLMNEVTSPSSVSSDIAETKSSPTPTVTLAPVSYSSGLPTHYISTGHYVTLKPQDSSTISIHSSNYIGYSSTTRPIITSKYTTPSLITKNKYSTPKPAIKFTSKPVTKIPIKTAPAKTTTKPFSSSQSTSQAYDSFNRYPSDPSLFSDSVTTFTYVSSTTKSPTTTTRKPPSTSYVFSAKPSKRPVTSPSSPLPLYDIPPDSFSSVTPTVIVLNGFQSTKPPPAEEPEFVEISQEPFKRPTSQITVNNHIESTNNIYMNKQPSLTSSKPGSSPTIVITPKPIPSTTGYPNRPDFPQYSTASTDFYTEYAVSTYKPEQQTSPDDLINFPPVRNPMLNATGSNPAAFNTSISLSDNELEYDSVDFTTPVWQEDEKLNEKMNLFVNKIVGSLQGTFQELHDIVILDKKPNASIIKPPTTTVKPVKKPATTKKPTRLTTTTRKPLRTTKKPVKVTTQAKRTTTPAPTTTRRSVTTTKKPSKPTRKATTTVATTTATEAEESTTETGFSDDTIDYSDKDLCGVRPMVKSGRIVGGKNSKFGEWPWQVLVRESTWLGLFTKNKCGGVLITSRFVTTAAHCQPGFLASLVAVFGENDISGDLEPRRPVSRNVRRVIVHRNYDAATFENDLAVLELESPIKFDAHIVPICMPPDEADFTGRMATVTGWGRLKYGGGVPAVLQEVQVPVIENSVCQEMFQTAGHSKVILNSFLCAGYANGQKDSCEGDSGGPLVLQRADGRWQLAGTVSHGIKCASPYLPGVYMRTTYYKPWLKSLTGVH